MTTLHRLLRKPFFGRFEVPWVWPVEEDQTSWERVSFTNPSGASLSGLWGAALDEAIGTLVLAHPMGKAAKGFWLKQGHASLFRRSGLNVLVFDANGFGESPATSFDYPADILAAGQWAQSRTPKLNVGLVGASFGAGWGLCALARAGSPFKLAVLEAAFPTLPEFWKHYPVAQAALKTSKIVWPSLERKLRPEAEAPKALGHPSVLLIYGEKDKYTPPEHGQRLMRAFGSAADTQLLVLPDVEHTFAYRDAADAYTARVIPFLKQLRQSAA
ncbi:MAG: alpha/beta hydrolase [Betaproteobacteria bacterium]|nr:MAG: alpha/beta hydrolase [Betaproteobacteria bacterium]